MYTFIETMQAAQKNADKIIPYEILLSPMAKSYLKDCLRRRRENIPAVQATLKMSGHLIIARGLGNFIFLAAKNSTNNSSTAASELLLSELMGGDIGLRALAHALEEVSACISFECVTSFNGDHGYPGRSGVDVLICTAIHSLTVDGPSIPWSQGEIFKFCQHWGLICSQSLLAFDPSSAESVFNLYELLRHQFGPHSRQVHQFLENSVSSSANRSIATFSCLPHHLISSVIEGFVVQSVVISRSEAENILQMANNLDNPQRCLNFNVVTSHRIRNGIRDLLNVELDKNELGVINKEENLEKILSDENNCSIDPSNLRSHSSCMEHCIMKFLNMNHPSKLVLRPKLMGRYSFSTLFSEPSRVSNRSQIGKMVDKLLGQADSDSSTRFIANVLRTCATLNIRGQLIHYCVTDQPAVNDSLDLFFIQVFSDSDHFKFHRYADQEKNAGILNRGFVFRMWTDGAVNNEFEKTGVPKIRAEVFVHFYPKFDNANELDSKSIIQGLWPKKDEKIVWGGIKKFKFSYYMYATMLCRGLVSTMSDTKKLNSGPQNLSDWISFCKNKMSKWKMPPLLMEPYLRRLSGWWMYLNADLDRLKKIDLHNYLDAFGDFLDSEQTWCKLDSKLTGFGKSAISRPIFFIAGGNATGSYAEELAQLLDTILVTEHPTQKNGRCNLSEDRFYGSVTVVNPTELEVQLDQLQLHKKLTENKFETDEFVGRQLESSFNDLSQIKKSITDVADVRQSEEQSSASDLRGSYVRSFLKNHVALTKASDIPSNAWLIFDLNEVNRGKLLKCNGKEWIRKAELSNCRMVDLSLRNDLNDPVKIAKELKSLEANKILPWLVVPLGFLGTGKSTIASRLADCLGANVISSEVIESKGNGLTKVVRLNSTAYTAALKASLQPHYLHASNPLHPPITVRDKNLPLDAEFQKTLNLAHPGHLLAIVFGATRRDFVDEENADKFLESVPPLTLWELGICMHRVLNRREHPSIRHDAVETPGLVCQYALRLYRAEDVLQMFDGSATYSRKDWLDDIENQFGGPHKVVGIPICRNVQYTTAMPETLKELLKIGITAFQSSSKCVNDSVFSQVQRIEGHKMVPNLMAEDKAKGFGPLQILWANMIRQELSNHDELLGSVGYHIDDEDFALILNDRIQEISSILVKSSQIEEPLDSSGIKNTLTPFKEAKSHSTLSCKSPISSESIFRRESRFYYNIMFRMSELIRSIDSQSLNYVQKWLKQKWCIEWDLNPGKTMHVTLFYPEQQLSDDKFSYYLNGLEPLLGSKVQISISASASDGKSAVFVVQDEDMKCGDITVPCLNKFPHITISTASGIPPKYSNYMLESGEYELFSIQGKFFGTISKETI